MTIAHYVFQFIVTQLLRLGKPNAEHHSRSDQANSKRRPHTRGTLKVKLYV
jgi:hypothetical protein